MFFQLYATEGKTHVRCIGSTYEKVFTNDYTLFHSGPIAPGETYKSPPVEVSPYRFGSSLLMADFDANEIKNIKVTKLIRIA